MTLCLILQYIDMDDPKAALAKTLNQTALTQDGALAAMNGISPALTQGVRNCLILVCEGHSHTFPGLVKGKGGPCIGCAPNSARVWHESRRFCAHLLDAMSLRIQDMGGSTFLQVFHSPGRIS